MSDAAKTIFISYRRKVSAFIARAIFQDLRTHGYDVFMDVENIDSGTFDTIILNQIEARAHFLVILTPGTLNRCVNADDWLRKEIEHAMGCGRNIVPVLVNDFKFDRKVNKFLTGKLEQLSRLNGLTLPHEYFDAAMERLRERYLKQPAPGNILRVPQAEQTVVEEKIEEAAKEPVPTSTELSAEDWFSRAFGKHESGDVEGAIEDYTEAIRLKSDYADAYINRGVAHRDKGDVEGAIADYDTAIRLRPGDAEVYYNRGVAHRDKGDVEGAIADYDTAIRLKPDDADAYNNRGLARAGKGDVEGAIADYDTAIRLKPDDADAYN
ncbi:MAG: tetratricopeptide repeat protein, partial [Anaerolineae bacterium]|nr:tetratricopeptide repeat protein [Anaerolineae bacterium]